MEPGELITTVFGLIVVNLVLSGDNAVVIGMAAHRLLGRQRTIAIVFGGVAAIVLRAVFTAAAAILLQIPAVQFVGGALLIWIAFRLLGEEVGGEEGHRAAESIWQAMWIIMVADVIMSLDNILAVAAVSGGNMTALVGGLVMSMPLVLFCGGLVAALMSRFPWLNYLGAIVIAWTAGEMMLADSLVGPLLPDSILVEMGIPLLLAIGVPLLATFLSRRARVSYQAGEDRRS